LEGLERLHLNKNELHSLPSDLFIGMSKLKKITFRDNKLEFLSSKILEPISGNNLKIVSFRQNTKINAFLLPGERNVETVQELMDVIDEHCKRPVKEMDELHIRNFSNLVKEMWETKIFSDFTIIVGEAESKEFAVHKCVVASQSSVFATIFKNEMKEKKVGKMTIDDFTADVVEGMLEFLYTGQSNNESNAMDLFAIAAKYDIATLKTDCEKLIICNIDEFNALEVFALGYLHN
jgi:BTB/POZ domain/Leucine rich repeat